MSKEPSIPSRIVALLIQAKDAGAHVRVMEQECDYGGGHVNVWMDGPGSWKHPPLPEPLRSAMKKAGFSEHSQSHEMVWCEGMIEARDTLAEVLR